MMPGSNHVAVLSYAFWQRGFSGDRTIVGKSITLNGEPFTVIGVMAAGITYPAVQKLDVWLPLSYFGPDQIGRVRGSHFLSADRATQARRHAGAVSGGDRASLRAALHCVSGQSGVERRERALAARVDRR